MNILQVKKQAFLKEACFFFENASLHSDAGDLQACACLILKALDKDRRPGGLRLQVLNLIKIR